MSPSAVCALPGTMRSRSAAETLAWLQPKLAMCGISRVANITGLDCVGIPVYVAIRPLSKNLAVSQGKGVTRELAQISAIMEAIEDFHSENPQSPVVSESTVEELRGTGHRLLAPINLPPGWARMEMQNRSFQWIEAQQATHGERWLVPAVSLNLDTTQRHPEYAYLSVSSNGLASGNDVDEALCHGLFEIVERHVLSLWRRSDPTQRHETRVDLATIDGSAGEILECFARAGLQVRVWDVRGDFAFPSYRCIISDPHSLRGLGFFGGAGCHLSKEIALSRALTEAAQSRLTMISGSRDDVFASDYEAMRLHDAFALESVTGGRNWSACMSVDIAPTFSGMRDQIVSGLALSGFHDVLFVDHTRADLGVPVIHAFVPGMTFERF